MSSEFTCMKCGTPVPDLGALKTRYRCERCENERVTDLLLHCFRDHSGHHGNVCVRCNFDVVHDPHRNCHVGAPNT